MCEKGYHVKNVKYNAFHSGFWGGSVGAQHVRDLAHVFGSFQQLSILEMVSNLITRQHVNNNSTKPHIAFLVSLNSFICTTYVHPVCYIKKQKERVAP